MLLFVYQRSSTVKNCQLNQIKTPTLFIHGYAGNYFSFGRMLKRFGKNGWGTKTGMIFVSHRGKVYFQGNPQGLTQVLFFENRDQVDQQVKWIWKILNQLKFYYQIPRVNIVAHSMGCVSVLKYLNQFGTDQRVASVEKVVTIGAPFNDLEVGKRTPYIENYELTADGPVKMTPLYQWMRDHQMGIPSAIKFLNIAGNLQNGSHSDGQVSVNSALSLRFLVRNIKNYRELVIHGKRAGHSNLHENQQVDQAIFKFLKDD